MERTDFVGYNNKPCRFKMRSGKEVFGVIWEKSSGSFAKYYFASLAERFSARIKNESREIGMIIDLNDVVGAELLDESTTMVS